MILVSGYPLYVMKAQIPLLQFQLKKLEPGIIVSGQAMRLALAPGAMFKVLV